MIEKTGDLWNSGADVICIPTNGQVITGGDAVTGRGLALQASKLDPDFKHRLGKHLREHGNIPGVVGRYEQSELVSFPTKADWRFRSRLPLIVQSCHGLVDMMTQRIEENPQYRIALPRVGCGLGHLAWPNVKPVLEEWFVKRNYEIWMPKKRYALL